MMGTKHRSLDPLPHGVSPEDLVPKDHFYRRLEETLNLSFVRELVAPLYAAGGRPSVDPVVFFKLQLVMFFEDLFGFPRLRRLVAEHPQEGSLVDFLMDELRSFTGDGWEQEYDIALVTLRRSAVNR